MLRDFICEAFIVQGSGMLFCQEQQIFMLECFFARKSYSYVTKEFLKKYPDTAVSNNLTVTRLVHRFRTTGSVADKKSAFRPSILNDEKPSEVETKFLRSPRKSARKIEMECGISKV